MRGSRHGGWLGGACGHQDDEDTVRSMDGAEADSSILQEFGVKLTRVSKLERPLL
jgi:hypothetical protein